LTNFTIKKVHSPDEKVNQWGMWNEALGRQLSQKER